MNTTGLSYHCLRPLSAIVPIAALLVAGCSDSSDGPGGTIGPPVTDPEFDLVSVSNGFGLQLPHIGLIDDGSGEQIELPLRTLDDYRMLEAEAGLVRPTVGFPDEAVLPDGRAGNQFFLAQFTDAVDMTADCFLACPGTGTCYDERFELITFDPATNEEVIVPARVFIGGYTRNAEGNLEQWVTVDPASGELQLTRDEADGFPGAEAPQLFGAADFAAPSSIIVVMDADDDLSTFESFPAAAPLQLRVPASLCSTSGVRLLEFAVASASVGTDSAGPGVAFVGGAPKTNPRDGEQAVDPTITPEIRFTKAVQPSSIGRLTGPPQLGSIDLIQASDAGPSPRAYNVLPRSAFDLTTWNLIPDRPFDGLDPGGNFVNIAFAEVAIRVRGDAILDLPGLPGSDLVQIEFLVNRGATVTNAPVVPESLVLSVGGDRSGLSVLDLNGFGQSTGNPNFSLPFPLKGETRFPFNPNLTMNPSVRPLLNPGTTTLNGGSAGVFTLTLDLNMDSVLAGDPILADASDMQYGWSLDTAFNNSPPPFGCQAGGGDVCAISGLKTLSPNPEITLAPGFPNLISFPPHPNPPGLVFPGHCVFPAIDGDEPTGVNSGVPFANLLVNGNPFPDLDRGAPPTGLLGGRPEAARFYGPSFGQTSVTECGDYAVRQQIGQFFYVADQVRG